MMPTCELPVGGLPLPGRRPPRSPACLRPSPPWVVLPVWLLLLLPPIRAEAAPLVWETREGYRVAPLSVPQQGRNGFTLLPRQQTGILFTNHLSYERSVANQNLLNGAGLAAGDVDGDGWCDLYFCNLEGSNALYRNRGDWTFEDITAASGTACTNMISRAAAFADLNADGHLDLIVSSISGPNACLVNDGHGRFRDVTTQAGMVHKAGGHSYALADVDNDGDLDVYLANYGENSILRSGGTLSFRMVNGRPVVSGRQANRVKIIDGVLIELGEPDILYLNDGQGVFAAASWTDGRFLDETGAPLRKVPWDMGLSAMFRDLNQDTHPDLYVCNDFQTPDRIWINQGQGTFRAVDLQSLPSTSHFSMGIDVADLDRDGWDDFFVSDMLSRFHHLQMTQVNASNPPPSQVDQAIDRHQFRRNTLLHNRGDGSYGEIALFAGVDASDWTWSVVFLDVDLDGYEDLLIANGHAYDTQDLDMSARTGGNDTVSTPTMRGIKSLKEYPPLRTPNYLFRNRGDLTFEEVGQTWGFHDTSISHGITLADLDHDGDQDIAVSCLWDPPLIYRNDSVQPRLAVRLKGRPGNPSGIGARIRVTGGPCLQSQEMILGGRYLSSDDPMRVFAAGSPTNRLTIEVTWRDGSHSVVSNALPDHLYEILQPASAPATSPAPSLPPVPPLFADVSDRLNHEHQERAFNEPELQSLLPRGLARSGPGAAWADLDRDGDDDLAIGTAQAGFLAVFQNDGKGGFSRWSNKAWLTLFPDDAAGLVGWSPTPTRHGWLAARSLYENPGSAPELLFFDPQQPAAQSIPLPLDHNIGPLALADYDRDGDLDVFVGGRSARGRYPAPADSLLLRNDKGTLVPDLDHGAALKGIGFVNGAVWSDLDQDGWPDLVMACEWGPIRILHNQGGTLQDASDGLGFAAWKGLWQGVTTADVNGDGRLDIIAGNWGLNSVFGRPERTSPRLVFGDLDHNGTVDLLEAIRDPATQRIVPRRNLAELSTSIPLLKIWYPTHKAFSQTDVPGILKHAGVAAEERELTMLTSAVFLNEGTSFRPLPLPDPAQWAPARSVVVADFDGDGREDLFLSQNAFDLHPEDFRLDAGLGLLLRGLGDGSFDALKGEESGIRCRGNQRAAATADFNGDGRPDLLVTQNAGPSRLFANQGGTPGVRVRLAGPPGNAAAVGAVLRLHADGQAGPARELHAGSGFWSQDSAVTVLAKGTPPLELEVRWPDGHTTRSDVPEDALEIRVAQDGKVTRLK